MGKRAKVTVDWLRKGRMVEDLTILQNLIADSSTWKVQSAKLDERLFESKFRLQPLPNEVSTESTINRALGYEEVTRKVTTKMRPLVPVGSNTRMQVKSLFPTNLSSDEIDTLSYVFSRFVIEDAPKDYNWPLVPQGLDSLSAALFSINIISDFVGGAIPWLLPLWSIKVEEFRLDGLEKIYDSLISDKKVEDVLDDLEKIKESLTGILIQNALVVRSLAPQDPLSDKIDKWSRFLSIDRDSPKRVVDKTRQRIAAEVLEEIGERRGAKSVSLDETDLQRMTLTRWNIHALRPDGPTATDHEPMLKMFRGNINILDFEPLYKICKLLSKCEQAGRPVASEVDMVTGTKRRMAHYTLHRMAMILTERYLPTLSKMGLRYRFVFTEKQKPSITSAGLIKKMVLSESSHDGCTVHIEPMDSEGPTNSVSPNCIQMTLNSELISMRLDLYDKKSKTWILEPWKPASKILERNHSWLYRKTEYDTKPTVKLTTRQIDLIGPLLTFRGLRKSRMWMMERLGLVPKTTRQYLHKMLDDNIFRLLYAPALEYCGLPEGMLIAGAFKEPQLRKPFIDWMISRIPFVHVFIDKSTNMVAYIRLPPYKTDVVGGVIREKLSGGNAKQKITTQSITARLRSYKTYQMTTFQRIFQKSKFIDPWES
ncbi:MAG: hypothetical protein AM325_004800 [Candidatus Thorarchaeota archaeon SMTZ1-45]|nr:MAG: hypothetical protein AM325_06565 [Candidatus Thorarchaeota archaeon SMTZ1-45]